MPEFDANEDQPTLPATGQEQPAEPAEQDLPVLVAGEPERIARAARIAQGIEIDDTTWAQLSAIAERYQIRPEG